MARHSFRNLGLVAVFSWLCCLSSRRAINNLYSLIGALLLTCLFLVYAMRKGGRRFRTELISPYLLAFACIVALASCSRPRGLLASLFPFPFYMHAACACNCQSVKDDRKSLNGFLIAMLSGFAIAVLYGCYQARTGVEIVRWQVDLEA